MLHLVLLKDYCKDLEDKHEELGGLWMDNIFDECEESEREESLGGWENCIVVFGGTAL